MVATGMLMVALPHLVGQVSALITDVHIANEALLASALRTSDFLLSAARYSRAFECITIIIRIHNNNL